MRMDKLFVFVLALGVCLGLKAQTEVYRVWVGEPYECNLRDVFSGEPYNISWTVEGVPEGFISLSPNEDCTKCIVKPIRFFSETARIKCVFDFMYNGIPQTGTQSSWYVTCIDNPVSISPTSLSLEVGKTQHLYYSHENEMYANEAIVSFEGEGSAIEVTSDGEVKAIQPGTAKVYAYSNLSKEKSNPCIVTVTDSQAPEFTITLDKGNMTIEKGESMSLYATVTPSDVEYTINWETSDQNVATVKKDSNNRNKALVTAKGKGSATISATIDGTDKVATCDVTVTITPTSIQMPQNHYTLFVGDEIAIFPTVEPNDADYTLTWESNDPDVATVTPTDESGKTGKVRAISTGEANITATIVGSNLNKSCKVIVKKPKLTVTASPNGGVVNKGTKVTLSANSNEANIYYTTDGTTPNQYTQLYKTPIRINQDCKIKAIAIQDGYENSDIFTASYKIRKVPGDVNDDSETNIADINAIINVILDEADIESKRWADINSDSEVNIADVNAVIDIILNPKQYVQEVETFIVNGVEFNMIYIEGGTFTMGTVQEPVDDDDDDDEDPRQDEYPAHEVTVSSFKMGQTEVTQELWETVMGYNPSEFSEQNGYYDGPHRPVENVSWDECQRFISKLNQLTGQKFRLPTEAEWEYAAKEAGNEDKWDWSAWYWDEYAFFAYDHNMLEYCPFATIPINNNSNWYGLSCILGNVAEWCQDWYGEYTDQSLTNPIGRISGTKHVIRGGDFNDSYKDLTVSTRFNDDNVGCFVGLRLVLSDIEIFNANGVQFAMMPVSGGTFTMGSSSEQVDDAEDDEKPPHKVTLSSYSIGQTEVTKALWDAIMHYEYSGTSELPVEISVNATEIGVYLIDLYNFLERLNEITGREFRRPTEAEWEFAARGGNMSKGYKYAGSNNIDDVAWCSGNSGSERHKVALKAPNELGIYDMSGNAIEVCDDYYYEYTNDAQVNPGGTESFYVPITLFFDSSLSLRGGYYDCIDKCCRVSTRWNICKYWLGFNYENSEWDIRPIGIRLVLSPKKDRTENYH